MWGVKLLCVFQYILVNAIYNVWIVFSIKLKMDDSTHVKMLIVQKMCKNHYNIQA